MTLVELRLTSFRVDKCFSEVNMKSVNAIILSTFIFISSCGMMPDRSYYEMMDDSQHQAMISPARDFRVVSGDTGQVHEGYNEILRRTPVTGYQKRQLLMTDSLESELSELESKLSEKEYQHYRMNERLLSSTSEKIYFLKISSMAQRDDYLIDRKPKARREIASIWSANFSSPLRLGMSKDQVQQMWGTPARIDIAGNPTYENERWAYHAGDAVRFVYFEHGRVDGWVTDSH